MTERKEFGQTLYPGNLCSRDRNPKAELYRKSGNTFLVVLEAGKSVIKGLHLARVFTRPRTIVGSEPTRERKRSRWQPRAL